MSTRMFTTDALDAATRQHLQAMLEAAYDGDFSTDDWHHALGGTHFVAGHAGAIVSHVSVVPRVLVVGDRPMQTGYVEAVATVAAHRGCGHATALMTEASDFIRARYELGALCTGEHGFYQRQGWERWRGPTFARSDEQWVRTPDEDDAVMVLRTAASPDLDTSLRISCEARHGDDW